MYSIYVFFLKSYIATANIAILINSPPKKKISLFLLLCSSSISLQGEKVRWKAKEGLTDLNQLDILMPRMTAQTFFEKQTNKNKKFIVSILFFGRISMTAGKQNWTLHNFPATSSFNFSTVCSFRNGRRTGSSCTLPARMALPASSFSTRPRPGVRARAEAAEAGPTRKPGDWTRRSSGCRSASPSCRRWRRPAPRTTWLPSVWRPTTRRTCSPPSTASPWTGWRLCATSHSRYRGTFNRGLRTGTTVSSNPDPGRTAIVTHVSY